MRTAAGRVRLAQTFVAGVALVMLAVLSLPPGSYNRDFRGDYLAARALRDGLDIYTPLPDLSERYFPIRLTTLPGPTKHPPVLVLLHVPMSFVPYEVMYPLALLVNVLLLLLVGRWLGLSIHGSLALAAWPPIWWVLDIGQLEILLLTLAMLGWRAAAGGHLWRAGVYLGLAACLKLYPIMLLVPYAARRQSRVLFAAGAVLALAQLANLLVVGADGVIRYYTEILPQYSGDVELAINASPYGALLRLFGGSADVEPLIYAPHLVLPLAAVFFLFGVFALIRLPPEAAPVGILITLPAAWGYHAVLALPQIGRLLRLPEWRAQAFAAAAAASFAQPIAANIATAAFLFVTGWSGNRAPPIAGLLGAIQTAGFLALLIIALRAGRARGVGP